MIGRVGLLAALGLIAVASPVAAQAQSPQRVTVTGRDAEAEDKAVVCKYQANTGTRFKTKTCRTREQWDAIREQQMRDAREFIDKPSVNTARGG